MNVYEIDTVEKRIADNPYVGRGIITGTSENGRYAVNVYFIMGRSANSRNRVFAVHDGAVFTEPFDASQVEDPRLIIYAAVRACGNHLIVTNGDQTDTVFRGLKEGKTLEESLEERSFEPDSPHFTPRISSISTFDDHSFRYRMSILKSIDEIGSDCARYTFSYPSKPGLGHFIHTYETDGDPLPTFRGEPERVFIPNDRKAFAASIWNSLNRDNKISLYVRYTDLADGSVTEEVINKNKRGKNE